jgi:hypothetical protein
VVGGGLQGEEREREARSGSGSYMQLVSPTAPYCTLRSSAARLMRQVRGMLAPSRRVASLVYGASLVSTLLSTLLLRRDAREIEEGRCSLQADEW